jgi:single-strand DNA-binding protein
MANTITVTGNLTRDPELRFTQGGRAVANFRIASSRRFQMNNEWQEQTSFFDVVAWAELGENAAASLSKGARVIVTGRIEQRDFETREGEKRTVFEITADEIGPSLRWATAQVERTDRSGGGGGGGGGDRSYGGSSGGGRPSENQSYGGGDEEPF